MAYEDPNVVFEDENDVLLDHFYFHKQFADRLYWGIVAWKEYLGRGKTAEGGDEQYMCVYTDGDSEHMHKNAIIELQAPLGGRLPPINQRRALCELKEYVIARRQNGHTPHTLDQSHLDRIIRRMKATENKGHEYWRRRGEWGMYKPKGSSACPPTPSQNSHAGGDDQPSTVQRGLRRPRDDGLAGPGSSRAAGDVSKRVRQQRGRKKHDDEEEEIEEAGTETCMKAENGEGDAEKGAYASFAKHRETGPPPKLVAGPSMTLEDVNAFLGYFGAMRLSSDIWTLKDFCHFATHLDKETKLWDVLTGKRPEQVVDRRLKEAVFYAQICLENQKQYLSIQHEQQHAAAAATKRES
ncbi:unnamed protein product [Vitrella brassicaformis CCMP3155]|uniref:Uncharacterized protein n=1 Tax=Vitrella brassicaformis (strain CCMP3155) TaxID=1169540 RepID=A0A0G4ENG0_VITBC|nr:unnamed protein product [Vitrella brassicaformis CCMP3155]|mmetsp:Transcript_8401/g.20546  ORF Transcript_8401/g.20546 Transcript_8401/m.20546 type:complete len:353 (-) Transcript_8401:271-1329(-)|eukprot:CEL99113.1 unnamed protein product [Vitrella brassicaformis CCMP3155]